MLGHSLIVSCSHWLDFCTFSAAAKVAFSLALSMTLGLVLQRCRHFLVSRLWQRRYATWAGVAFLLGLWRSSEPIDEAGERQRSRSRDNNTSIRICTAPPLCKCLRSHGEFRGGYGGLRLSCPSKGQRTAQRPLGGARMGLLVFHVGWGVLPADGAVVGVAEVDVPGEAVGRVLEP